MVVQPEHSASAQASPGQTVAYFELVTCNTSLVAKGTSIQNVTLPWPLVPYTQLQYTFRPDPAGPFSTSHCHIRLLCLVRDIVTDICASSRCLCLISSPPPQPISHFLTTDYAALSSRLFSRRTAAQTGPPEIKPFWYPQTYGTSAENTQARRGRRKPRGNRGEIRLVGHLQAVWNA